MTLGTIEFILAISGFACCAVGMVINLNLKNYVSMDKVRQAEHQTDVFDGSGGPSPSVLDSTGLILLAEPDAKGTRIRAKGDSDSREKGQ